MGNLVPKVKVTVVETPKVETPKDFGKPIFVPDLIKPKGTLEPIPGDRVAKGTQPPVPTMTVTSLESSPGVKLHMNLDAVMAKDPTGKTYQHHQMLQNPPSLKTMAAMALTFGVLGVVMHPEAVLWIAEKFASLLGLMGLPFLGMVMGGGSKKPSPTLPEGFVEDFARISDQALDKAYGYGLSQPGTFGWEANQGSARKALELISTGVTDIEQISAAIHEGWAEVARTYEDPVYQTKPEKKQNRLKLADTPYEKLAESEKEKDRVVAQTLLEVYQNRKVEAQKLRDQANQLEQSAEMYFIEGWDQAASIQRARAQEFRLKADELVGVDIPNLSPVETPITLEPIGHGQGFGYALKNEDGIPFLTINTPDRTTAEQIQDHVLEGYQETGSLEAAIHRLNQMPYSPDAYSVNLSLVGGASPPSLSLERPHYRIETNISGVEIPIYFPLEKNYPLYITDKSKWYPSVTDEYQETAIPELGPAEIKLKKTDLGIELAVFEGDVRIRRKVGEKIEEIPVDHVPYVGWPKDYENRFVIHPESDTIVINGNELSFKELPPTPRDAASRGIFGFEHDLGGFIASPYKNPPIKLADLMNNPDNPLGMHPGLFTTPSGPAEITARSSEGKSYRILVHTLTDSFLPSSTLLYVKDPSHIVMQPDGTVTVTFHKMMGEGPVSFTLSAAEAQTLGLRPGEYPSTSFMLM